MRMLTERDLQMEPETPRTCVQLVSGLIVQPEVAGQELKEEQDFDCSPWRRWRLSAGWITCPSSSRGAYTAQGSP